MSVQRHCSLVKDGIAWQVLFCLAILSFLSRSLVPAGYMPGSLGEQNGFFSVTLCAPGGTPSTIWMSLTGQADPPQSNEHADMQKCPYALVLSQVALPSADMASLDIPALHQPLLLVHRNQSLPPLPALGPPLGSRAPPVNLA
ncbi:DUF2946 family protein [Alcaligenes nematophilus]|uniref:DUF2946 family protein n=1 Tax=Alcaligenes TaxID=507 RepID=UPI001008213D|nr:MULTISPECIES: DUF2946 family protein [Alcaligenes]